MRKKTIFIGILIIIVIFAFFSGAIAYKYKNNIPGINYFRNLISTEAQYSPPEYNNPKPLFEINDIEYPFSFIVYGDSRELAGPEKELIIKRIINENPLFVIHTGDMVESGDSHQWEIFDLFEGKILRKNISFYPVLGNHEYGQKEGYLNSEEQLKHYFKRFNLGKRRWYSFLYGNSLFLIIDSNIDYSEGSKQYNWLIDCLKKKTKFLFISLHHPLYTKSAHIIRKKEKNLANLLENPFNGLTKPDIVFSGHVHNYERYQYNDITYIVSGGGGAPYHKVKRSPDDFYIKSGETYHYCKITVFENKIEFEMIKLEETGNWIISDTFTIEDEAIEIII